MAIIAKGSQRATLSTARPCSQKCKTLFLIDYRIDQRLLRSLKLAAEWITQTSIRAPKTGKLIIDLSCCSIANAASPPHSFGMNEKAISAKAARSAHKTGKAAPQRERGRPVGDRTAQKTKLVKAAMSVIAEDGYRAASVRKVAMRAGFTTGAVSYYFDDKVSMIVAAAEHLFDEFDAMLRALRHSAGLGQGAERWLTWMADTELWMANAQLIAYAAREPRCAEVFSRRYAHYRDNYAAILEDWQRSGSVRDDLPAAILADQLCAISDGWMQLLPVEPARFAPDRLPRLIEGLIQLMAPAPSAATG